MSRKSKKRQSGLRMDEHALLHRQPLVVTTMVPITELERLQENALRVFTIQKVLYGIQAVEQHVHAVMVMAAISERAKHLQGADESMASLIVRLVGEWRQAALPVDDESFTRTVQRAHRYIEGIQRLTAGEDDGEHLSQVIKEADQGGAIAQLIELLENRTRQGQHLNPVTKRVYELVEDARASGITGWAATTEHIQEWLSDYASTEAEIDLRTVLDTYPTTEARAKYLKATHYNFKKGKAGKHYLAKRSQK